MLIDAALWEVKKIEEINAPGLLLPLPGGDEAFLVLPQADHLAAVILSGEWIYHSERVDKISNREGIFTPNVAIRADLESMVAAQNGPKGALLRGADTYGIKTTRNVQNGFAQNVVVSVDGLERPPVQNATRVAFWRWEIGQWRGDAWEKLWAVDVTPPEA